MQVTLKAIVINEIYGTLRHESYGLTLISEQLTTKKALQLDSMKQTFYTALNELFKYI